VPAEYLEFREYDSSIVVHVDVLEHLGDDSRRCVCHYRSLHLEIEIQVTRYAAKIHTRYAAKIHTTHQCAELHEAQLAITAVVESGKMGRQARNFVSTQTRALSFSTCEKKHLLNIRCIAPFLSTAIPAARAFFVSCLTAVSRFDRRSFI
jgi:hypothetical protein